jgi:hypothetical protein
MRTLRNVVTGLCSMALVLTPVAAPLAGTVANEPWEIVPEDSLRDLRGGMDLGDLVASFAIQRVVEIDGVVVARMQMVISNLDRLANGGMPTITITGPIAEIVQFMKTAGNVSLAGSNSSVPSSVASLPTTSGSQAAPSAPVAPASAASASPTIASSGNSGSVSATTTQSGSMAQLGNALTNAVATAVNATSQPAPSTAAASPSTAGTASTSGSTANTASSAATTLASTANTSGGVANTSGAPANTASGTANTASGTANTASSAANAPGVAASNTHLQANATPAVSAQPTSPSAVSAAATTKIIPVGTSGQVVVLSNMPNAAALTTAVQNEVHAATIQTQTTISATLNSMPSLNALSLGNLIRAQVSSGGG